MTNKIVSLKSCINGAVNFLLMNKDHVNTLNVFPVPDGDTGTNMGLTSKSALKQVNELESDDVYEVALAASRGSLMGARGNSGVILSQFLRGFAEGLKDKKTITNKDLAKALKSASDTTYKAVMKPTEGTILTVGRETADFAMKNYSKYDNTLDFMEAIVKASKESLNKTPEKLPVLKEAGVVDSGGAGLVYLFEGALKALKGEVIEQVAEDEELKKKEQKEISFDDYDKDLEFGYCTEFVIRTDIDDTEDLKNKLMPLGDCLLVVGGGGTGVIKVHVHTNNPGRALEYAVELGQLQDIKIDNMRYQHTETLFDESEVENARKNNIKKKYAIVSVSMGEGINEVFKSLNVDYIIEGGQTMNPSTEDFVKAIDSLNADHIILLPNNSNIVLAANQAKELSEKDVYVVETKSVPQGIGALFVFDEEEDPEANIENMNEELNHIKTGSVTYAVRDTNSNGFQIKKDQIIGLTGKEIESFGDNLDEVTEKLIEKMVDDESSVITLYYGNGLEEEDTEELMDKLEEIYDELDVELVRGAQPLYYYIVSVE